MNQNVKIGVIVGSATAVLTLVVLLMQVWPSIGWTTPNQHANDFVVAVEELKKFRDEWKCDEYDEELEDALDAQNEGDSSTKLRRHIEKLRKKMDDLNCSRFEDFG
jgi:hypothetical protein